MNDLPQRHADPGEHQDTIEPIVFRPADPGEWRRGPRFRPATLITAGALFALSLVAVFLFTSRPVLLEFSPDPESFSVSGGMALPLGDRILMRPGTYRVRAEREGYHVLDEPFTVARGTDAEFQFALRPLPGLLDLTVEPAIEGRVLVDNEEVGRTPLESLSLEPGAYELRIESERYLPWSGQIEIEGRGLTESVSATLEPAWAEVRLATDPPGAEVMLDDGTVIGRTPEPFELIQGTHELTVKLEGYKAWQQRLEITAGEDRVLDPVRLEQTDGLLMVTSRPAGATVTVNGNFSGRTPVEVELAPGNDYRVDLFRAGHTRVSRQVSIASGREQRLAVDLPVETGEVRIAVEPSSARVFVDGRESGGANQVLSLPAVSHEIEIRQAGYVPYRTQVVPRPGIPQDISLRLQTVEEARRASIRPEIETAVGQKMLLLRPGPFTMGASRREPGRRANEVLREVTLSREFYLSVTEVTNAQFRRFAAGHNSGEWESHSLDGDRQPVVNVSWEEAALFCNWLSEQDGLPPAYVVRNRRVVGFDPESTGYRLPTEAEWEWTARVKEDGEQLRFPWGDAMPPPDRVGNYADRTVSNLLGRTILGYTDGQMVSAAVANFSPNHRGIHDLGSNVAEWVNDFYAGTSEDLPSGQVDPLGPDGGDFHVIRGASWMHGTLTELRLTFRDFGKDGRTDVGFRIARYLE